jgi:hypothetical protein
MNQTLSDIAKKMPNLTASRAKAILHARKKRKESAFVVVDLTYSGPIDECQLLGRKDRTTEKPNDQN